MFRPCKSKLLYVKKLRCINCQTVHHNKRLFTTEQQPPELDTTQTKTTTPLPLAKDEMLAWQVKSFGKMENLELATVKTPIIKKPREVLIKVKATSVNPLDVAMIGGYGNVIMNAIRSVDSDLSETMNLPIILGRDFAGEVIAKGNDVRADIMIGDGVYGVIPPHLQGCHAEKVIADETLIRRKPDNISFVDAAGILYTGLTAWSSLKITGDLLFTSPDNKKVLVIGASGGVGTMAVQLLNAWKSEVVATCRTDAVSLVEGLSANKVIDYTSPDCLKEIESAGKYDIILDASGACNPANYMFFLKEWSNAKFITLRPPILKNMDAHGLMMGMVQNVSDFLLSNVASGAPSKGCSVRWAFFMPIPRGVNEIASLVCENKIKTVIHKVFDFKDLPAAYDSMSKGHVRGKIIINMEKEV